MTDVGDARATIAYHEGNSTGESAAMPVSTDLPPGSTAGEYIIEDLIARGGCGSVYSARHRTRPCRAAVKVLHSALSTSRKMVERFVREVEVVNVLRHPNIVEIYELGRLPDQRPFYAMEYLGGTTLDALLKDRGRLAPEEALDLLLPICSALSTAHAAGIIHRDIKPRNIAVVEDGGALTLKLLDFGIAKLTDRDNAAVGLTSAGRQLGTLSAMAPEQIRGEPVDARVDIYALGILLYRMLTGRLPFFSADVCELARQHIEEPAPRPSRFTAVPPALDTVVLRCLEKDPERRFESVRSFVSALRDAVGRPDGRHSLPPTHANAVGIYLEIAVEEKSGDFDDSLADDLVRILDMGEEKLRRGGFSLAVSTASSILGVRLLSGAPEDTLREREAALEIAALLHEEVERRAGGDRRVRAAVCVHSDKVLLQMLDVPEIVGGPIVRTNAWARLEGVAPGVCATQQALQGLSGFAVKEGPGPLFTIARRATGAPPSSPTG